MPSLCRPNKGAHERATPKKWEFVSVNEPKKNQDKDVISIVRAHAMRNVRRKQRLELTAQHQKRLKAENPKLDHAGPSGIADHSAQMDPYHWSRDNKTATDWPVAPRAMLAKLGSIDSAHLLNIPSYWQGFDEYETPGPESFMSELCHTVTPKSLIGDGVYDPFNAMPVPGCTNYYSHALNHFVSVMALNCLPVDQRKGHNPLTKIWLPYALQDSTLFLATLTFAEVHLEILSGNYKSRKTLLHKGDAIKAVNTKLGYREHTLSNETIGAVAMLAAIESILGNYKELAIHMNGLQRMVYMRGGLQSLGWDGILHMFISWQDLLSSAMMASAPRHEPTPCCLLIRGSLSYSNSIFPEIGLSTELCGHIATSFQDMRYLTQRITSWDKPQSTLEIMSFSSMRTDIVHRLLSIENQKAASEMSNLDYHVETCRLAALMYIKVALHIYTPLCAAIRNLKTQLMNLIRQGEANCTIGVGARAQPCSLTWALFVGGALSLNKEEEEWFAQRLAKGIRASRVETWAEMEDRLEQICWLDKLNTPTCWSLWNRVMSIHAEYWAGQVRSVASEWDRKGPVYWYPGLGEKAYASPGVSKRTLGNDIGPCWPGTDDLVG